MFISRRAFFMPQSRFVSEVVCSTVLTDLCVFATVQHLSLKTAQGWRSMLFALSLLNETVFLLSVLESIDSDDFKVKLKRN